MTPFNRITDILAAAPQITLEDVKRAKAEGYTQIMCNRPDHEDPGQLKMSDVETAAIGEGMKFVAIPFGRDGHTSVQRHEAASAYKGEKTLAYCRTGTRSTILYSFTRAENGEDVNTIIKDAAAGGYDLAPLKGQFETLAKA